MWCGHLYLPNSNRAYYRNTSVVFADQSRNPMVWQFYGNMWLNDGTFRRGTISEKPLRKNFSLRNVSTTENDLGSWTWIAAIGHSALSPISTRCLWPDTYIGKIKCTFLQCCKGSFSILSATCKPGDYWLLSWWIF